MVTEKIVPINSNLLTLVSWKIPAIPRQEPIHHKSGLDSAATQLHLIGVLGIAVAFNFIAVQPKGYFNGYVGTNKRPISSLKPNLP